MDTKEQARAKAFEYADEMLDSGEMICMIRSFSSYCITLAHGLQKFFHFQAEH